MTLRNPPPQLVSSRHAHPRAYAPQGIFEDAWEQGGESLWIEQVEHDGETHKASHSYNLRVRERDSFPRIHEIPEEDYDAVLDDMTWGSFVGVHQIEKTGKEDWLCLTLYRLCQPTS